MNHSLPSRSRLSLAACHAIILAAGSICTHAQPTEQIEYSIVWDKPVLMPGEVQTGHVWLTLTPDIGSTVQWNAPPGTGQAATLKAIASSIFSVTNIENGLSGTMIQWSRLPEWEVSPNFGGNPDGNGGIKAVNIGQFGAPTNPNPNTNASVIVFWFKWDPLGNYSPRSVTYEVSATSGKVFLEVPGLAAWVGENAVKVGSQSSFQVVPAPTELGVSAIGLIGLTRRRRR